MSGKSRYRGIPEEKAASREEIDSAFQELSKAQLIRLRSISRFRSLDLVGRFIEFEDEEDLLKKSLIKLFSGERKWDKEKVDFFGLLVKTMKSIADHARKHMASKKAGVETKTIHLEPNENYPNPIENLAVDQPSSERSLIAKQSIEIIEGYFSENPTVLEIIDGLQQGLNGSEIRELFDLSNTKYESARRKLQRGLNKLTHEGKINA